jgi:hypothetical protein
MAPDEDFKHNCSQSDQTVSTVENNQVTQEAMTRADDEETTATMINSDDDDLTSLTAPPSLSPKANGSLVLTKAKQ